MYHRPHLHHSRSHGWQNIQCEETEDAYRYSINIEGFGASDIDLKLDGHVLRIDAERKKYEGKHSESRDFHTNLDLPGDASLDVSRIQARYKCGVLEIIVQRTAGEYASRGERADVR